MTEKPIIYQDEIDKLTEQLTKVRDPDNLPTEQEVIEMLIRMKKRWKIGM